MNRGARSIFDGQNRINSERVVRLSVLCAGEQVGESYGAIKI